MLIFVAFWVVILLVVPYLCLFSLILQGLFEEGEFRQPEFWTGKGANPSPLFCTSPNALKIYVDFFWNILKILGERTTGGGLPGRYKPWHRHPLVAEWGLVGSLEPTWLGPKAPWTSSVREKIISGFFFRLDSVPKSDLKRAKNTEKTGARTWH